MSDSDYTLPVSASEIPYQNSKIKYGYKVLHAGDVIGEKYRIVNEIGSGGFATTYLAVIEKSVSKDVDSAPLEKCVVKQLQPRLNSQAIWDNARDRLDTEGMVLRWLGKHNQIPALIDHFDENSQFYLVLEFIEGNEFDREVQNALLNEFQIIQFLHDVLNILNFVHQQGVIHRDIKPSNLIKRFKDGKFSLIDFGAVKEIGTAIFDSPKEVAQTQVIGTPGYMPPEQHSGKPLYSSDIYALGKTAIYGLTGRTPTDWENIETNEMVSWYEKTSISNELAKIINRMTSTKTAERYKSVQEVLDDIIPLLRVGSSIDDRYLVMSYLGGEKQIDNYLVQDSTQENLPLAYLKLMKPFVDENFDLKSIKQALDQEITRINQVYSYQQGLKISECFLFDDSICVVQEFVEGSSYAQILQNHPTLSEEKVIDLLINVLDILANCHKKQIIHGNIKPSSLLQIKDDKLVLLTDFQSINDLVVGDFTENFLYGNLGYIPPEQIASRATYSSDIYALGMTAIHCLTGVVPQRMGMSTETGEILWSQDIKVDPSLIKILNKMTCLEQKKRYASASQVTKSVKRLKRKNRFKSWHLYLLVLPILLGMSLFILAQWAQRAAILEFYTGDQRLENRKYKKAIQYYDEGLKKLPKSKRQVQNFQQVWLQKARAYNELKDYENALKTCKEALNFYQSPQLRNCQGLAFDNLNQYDSAVLAYDKAIALDPEYVWSWNNRGDAYANLDKFPEAIADFEKAIELSPEESFVPWNNLGRVYYRQRLYTQAIDAYNNAVEIKKDYLPALVGLGNAYKSIRNFSAATTAYDQAIAINPNSYESWFGKALIAESLQKYEEATATYEKALRIKPDWESAQKGLERVQNR